jgi:ATP-dependent RNA helicase DeaD
VTEQEKLDALTKLLEEFNPELALVFCNTKRRTDVLARRLRARGYPAEKLNGDMSQNQRERVMARFRKGEIAILVATDVAARGIDVEGIDAVFNYDVPNDPEYYVHRIGRTARAGRSGRSFTLVTGADSGKIRDIQRYAKITPATEPARGRGEPRPEGRDQLLERVKPLLSTDLAPSRRRIEQWMKEGYSPLDIAAALLSLAEGR